MSNSFNISVKPEIAAAVVKIDAIKNDTGPIRNDVTAIHDTNLPAVKTDTGAIRNDVTAIHDTNLPAVKTDTGAIRNDVTDIHDTNLPALYTKVLHVDNSIDTIDGIVDSIKTVTDVIPLKLRGNFSLYALNTTQGTLQTVCNISGRGKLIYLVIFCGDGGDTIECQFTIDTLPSNLFTHTGDTTKQRVIFSDSVNVATSFSATLIPFNTSDINLLNVEFDTSLLVQIRRSVGSTASVSCKVAVSED